MYCISIIEIIIAHDVIYFFLQFIVPVSLIDIIGVNLLYD